MPELSRRDFLKFATRILLAGSSLLGLGGLIRFLGYQTEPSSPGKVNIGLLAKYPLGSRTYLPEVPAILVHNESGFSAMSLTCTHLGCTVKTDENGYLCPCHGSRFGKDGEVLHGPAQEVLPRLDVETTKDGNLIVNLG